ncbi:MAG: type II toxin-antitoxin system VapC family toxin [Sphaerochaetaceae bacterium]|nr:type II toxin-antitoxin system VapC family toxin [Sphaerochaetaceae bacterium]
MTIILDTHIFLWAIAEPEKLSSAQRAALQTRAHRIYVSSVSITELMIKASIGKMTVPFNPVEIAQETGFELLDYRGEDALLLKELPLHHKDPFDRMIISQGIAHGYTIMTSDPLFSSYPCKIF